ncbi:hypothetical protein SAMN05216360_10335 [Methylobacterium phyllostachyos]|uniref:Uncharacterized protein n=1 Tax=Methylobacterium phyllostachyos TaxID=582672 RepID=A0A1G9V1H7_9HYPH|nr:hypothetical protein [Methylobacterium phyllostachyos]SDM65930.1 hypothetical protein SAMN05216360_10335 [Methylobacterium phyllostachyos]
MTQDRPPAGLAGTVDHVDAGDGWLVVRLMTRQALVREGEHMQHCLRHGSYSHLAGEEEMTGDAIWSLRDPRGMSRATLDVRSRNVVMAKGKGNSDVGAKAARRLKALVAAFRAAGADLDFAGETGLIVAPNGYVCREEHAPPEVIEAVRAKHRAAVEARRERPLFFQNGRPLTLTEGDEDTWASSVTFFQGRHGVVVRPRLRPLPSENVPVHSQAVFERTAHMADPILQIEQERTDISDVINVTLRSGAQFHLRGAEVMRGVRPGEDPQAYLDIAIVAEALRRQPQPLRTITVSGIRAGEIYYLETHPVTDVTVSVDGADLRAGDDYHLGRAGLLQFMRDVPGEATVTFREDRSVRVERMTFGLDTMVIRQDENPHRSILPPVYDPILTVPEWCERELLIPSPRYRLVQSLSGRPVVLRGGPLG